MTTPLHQLAPIIPCNDLDACEAFYGRLGFHQQPPADTGDYRMLSDAAGAQVHLIAAVEGWVVPGRNPFGIYLYTRTVDEVAAGVRTEILEPGRAPEHKEWGMYEFSLSDPDGVLVRVGWPSRLMND